MSKKLSTDQIQSVVKKAEEIVNSLSSVQSIFSKKEAFNG